MSKVIARSNAGPPIPLRKPPTIGLALGGGGARGLAHILMLEAFEELGLQPAVISGTSIGAIFGAAYASGIPASLLRAHTEETLSQRFDLMRQLLSARADPIQKLFNLVPLRAALLNPNALLELLLPSQVAASFSELKIPLQIVATDFYAQEATVISTGQLRRAIAASMALPAIFQPVVIDGRALMDGGLVNPLPFDLLTGHADIIVAIDVSGASRDPTTAGGPSAFEALISSSQILQRSIVREKLKSTQPDIYIDVDTDNFHVLEFHHYKDIMAAAAPAKAALKRQLTKILGSETVAQTTPLVLVGPVAEDDAPKKKKKRRLLPERRSKKS